MHLLTRKVATRLLSADAPTTRKRETTIVDRQRQRRIVDLLIFFGTEVSGYRSETAELLTQVATSATNRAHDRFK